MWPESDEGKGPLRTGLTTGACATACLVAAAQLLLCDKTRAFVSVSHYPKASA